MQVCVYMCVQLCVWERERERKRKQEGGMAIFVQKISFNCHATRLQPSLLILISDTLSVSPFVRRRSHYQSESSDPPFSLFLLPLHRFHWDWQKVVVAAEAWSLLTRAATRLSNDHIWPKSKAAELASLSTARNTKMHRTEFFDCCRNARSAVIGHLKLLFAVL